MAEPGRLDNTEIQQRLARIDELLERIEGTPGPTAEAAIEAVQTLTEVYGEALARILGFASPPVVDQLVDDELVGHLLVLHDIHPEPVADRVERALDQVRPYIESHGGKVELAEIDAGIARVRLSGACKSCSSSAATLEQAVSDAVLALAPELTGVEQAREPQVDRPVAAMIPVEALLRRSASVGGPA